MLCFLWMVLKIFDHLLEGIREVRKKHLLPHLDIFVFFLKAICQAEYSYLLLLQLILGAFYILPESGPDLMYMFPLWYCLR